VARARILPAAFRHLSSSTRIISGATGSGAITWAASTRAAAALTEPSDLAVGVSPPSRPARPFARGGPRNIYIEWRANPEYDLRGYHVYRQEVVDAETAATPGGCFSPATNWIKPGPIAISVIVGNNAFTADYQTAAGKQAAGGDLLLLACAASALLAANRRKQT